MKKEIRRYPHPVNSLLNSK